MIAATIPATLKFRLSRWERSIVRRRALGAPFFVVATPHICSAHSTGKPRLTSAFTVDEYRAAAGSRRPRENTGWSPALPVATYARLAVKHGIWILARKIKQNHCRAPA